MRRARRLEGVRQTWDDLEIEPGVGRDLTDEAGDGFGHHATFLSAGAALDQHLKVELLGRKAFERALADGTELPLVHVFEQPLLEVSNAELAGVVVAEHALDMGGGENLADDVEDRVIVQGVADFLEFFQEALEYAALDGVGSDEVEDQAVFVLAPIPVT